ncbi:hypothetical protein K5M36_16505 [Chromobacterium vaccinii]|nr:hypothetical protein [Chromobacterium vaccinii]
MIDIDAIIDSMEWSLDADEPKDMRRLCQATLTASAEQRGRVVALTIETAPIGTKAPAIMGGYWYRNARGWKWNGPDGSGATFPRPGGDWSGELIAPQPVQAAGQADRAVYDSIASNYHQQPATAVTQDELHVIAGLIELARVVTLAMDDSEERCGDEGRVHLIDSDNFDFVSAELDGLDELPDDKPGYTLGPAGKAEWALRGLLAAVPATGKESLQVQAVPGISDAVIDDLRQAFANAARWGGHEACHQVDVRALLAGQSPN